MQLYDGHAWYGDAGRCEMGASIKDILHENWEPGGPRGSSGNFLSLSISNSLIERFNSCQQAQFD